MQSAYVESIESIHQELTIMNESVCVCVCMCVTCVEIDSFLSQPLFRSFSLHVRRS